jgi:hypothetical protein
MTTLYTAKLPVWAVNKHYCHVRQEEFSNEKQIFRVV